MSIVRRVKWLVCRKWSFFVFPCILLIWMCGVLDHLAETSFDNFQWPPYDINVLVETRRALSGKPARVASENDVRSFRHIALPKCQSPSTSSKLFIIVKSSIANIEQRNAIRKTWGAGGRHKSVQTMFIVGKSTDGTVQTDVHNEIEKHGDILYVDSIDTYRNNTRKFIHSIIFSFEPGNGCQSPKFLLLIDDDYMVNVAGLLRHLSEESHSLHLYEGWMFDTTPFRFRLHKHSVSLKMYPYDRYPPYISAGAVLMSRNTFVHFYYALQLVRIYPLDDIYAGILAYLLQIRPRHNEAFVFWTRSINADEWKRGDVLVAHGYSPDQLIHEYSEAIHSA
ncbi:Hexosyltransferase [Trichostrongylus colubriformis]|uniref:Hexosyltransferase n=1 Tax=Trichostrongylus colubriformis TaxID=6319 RepID=A0AAN8F852_TRICO